RSNPLQVGCEAARSLTAFPAGPRPPHQTFTDLLGIVSPRMKRVAALLAVTLLGAAISGCGGGGAEPGAPQGATLVLDFQPNAVHSGVYSAQANGDFKGAGTDLHIQEPSSSADSAKLLAAGRADFAVMDINDFGIARERGLDLVAIAA